MYYNQLQQKQERESVGQENATHVFGDNVCCARLKEMTSYNCDTLVSAATKYSF